MSLTPYSETGFHDPYSHLDLHPGSRAGQTKFFDSTSEKEAIPAALNAIGQSNGKKRHPNDDPIISRKTKKRRLSYQGGSTETPTAREAPKISPLNVIRPNPAAFQRTSYASFRGPPPPPSPIKNRSKRPLKTNSAFHRASKSSESGTMTINGISVQLLHLASGSYLNVYTLAAPGPISRERPNDELVVKVFNKRRSNQNAKFLRSIMSNSLRFYRIAQDLKLPIATILNEAQAVKQGFYIQEKIPHSVNVLDPSHIEQVREFFIFFLNNKGILLDLLPDNLRVTEDGVVKLIDFVEEIDDSWNLLFDHALASWCRLYAQEISADKSQILEFIQMFTEGFETLGYDRKLILEKFDI